MKIIVCVLFSLTLFGCSNAAGKLQQRYSWRQLDWVFPNQQTRDRAVASGDYVPTNGLPVGIERWQNKLFVTVPRWRNGIPAVLNYIDMNRTPSGSPPLIPYPSLENNIAGDCANGLSTVYRIKADKCGRLWVLDTGTVGIGNTTQNVCPYALNVFDLATDRRIRRYEFRPEDTNPNTFIANIAIDIGKNCEDTYAYFSDELGYGLISYSWEQNKSWRFAHSFFFPDPLRGDFNIGGLNFQWGEEGIFGMALSPIKNDGFRTLYFSPLASHREFSVSTKTLRDSTRLEESFHEFTYLPERAGNAHTTSRVMSESGVMLFNLIDQNSVGCWNSATPYEPQNHAIVDRDDEGLVFPADVKIDETNTVWVISDRMPVFLLSELAYNDVNFRIFSAPLDNLLQGTVCAARRPFDAFTTGPVSPRISSTTRTSIPFQYLGDISSESFSSESFSREYPELTTPFFGFASQPAKTNTRPYSTTQVPASSKAYVYNQHNGVSLKTETPTYPDYYPDQHQHHHHHHHQNSYYQPRGSGSSYQKKNDWPQYFY
ncbi:CLUMA_CG006582, isoform A [Clunio marinus]|uniref:Protein yellow n=1 Tax=Clunio marinus TaxID=568069 RepID=A0A1J1HYD8_9DIPT|nr:CLUMA_CG006582, isoform A [Clunio marinus]